MDTVRYRWAMMLLASAGGNRFPGIAQMVPADEDTVRDVIHRFNEIGLSCLDPRRPVSSRKLKRVQHELTDGSVCSDRCMRGFERNARVLSQSACFGYAPWE